MSRWGLVTGSSLLWLTVALAAPTVRPGWPYLVNGSVRSSPLVAPAGVGGATLAISGSSDGRLHARHLDGSPGPGGGILLQTGASITGTPAWGDVTGDGRPEIVVGSYNGTLYLIRIEGPDGTVVRTGFSLGSSIYATPALGQLDDDPEAEIVVGTFNGLVAAINGDGSPVPGWPFLAQSRVRSSAALANLDDDPYDEAIVGSDDTFIYGLDHDGTERFRIATGQPVVSSPTIGNLDDDAGGSLEIAAGSSDGVLYVFDAQGRFLPGFPRPLAVYPDRPDQRNDCDSSPTFVDLNGDGRRELVVGSDNGLIHALHADATYVAGFPVETGLDVFSSASVADTDGDGAIELYVGSADGLLYGLSPAGEPLAGFPFDFGVPRVDRDGDGVVRNDVNATATLGDFDGDGAWELATNVYEEARLAGRLYLLDLPQRPVSEHDHNRDGAVDAFDALLFGKQWNPSAGVTPARLAADGAARGPQSLLGFIAAFHSETAAPFPPYELWPTFRGTSLRPGTIPDLRAPYPGAVVEGLVLDGADRARPVQQARVELYRNGSGAGAARTDAGGRFRASAPEGLLRIEVSAPGTVPATVYCRALKGKTATCAVTYLVPTSSQRAAVTGTVRAARDASPIAGAQVELFAGIDAGAGGAVASAVAAQGGYLFEGLAPGSYTAVASASGYTPARITVVAVGGQTTSQSDLFLAPAPPPAQVRIVLSWRSRPFDLDAHLTGPGEGTGGPFHVSFADRGRLDGPPYAALDVDREEGLGPETIAIARLLPGTYRYFVHDFSAAGDAAADDLSNKSGAVVDVFLPGGPQTFWVPRGQAGTVWEVFELDGATGTVTVLNQLTARYPATGMLSGIHPRKAGPPARMW